MDVASGGVSCLLLPAQWFRPLQHPLIRFDSEVPGDKLRLALTSMRTVRGLLTRTAQLDFEAGK